jgi:hypothetical protein
VLPDPAPPGSVKLVPDLMNLDPSGSMHPDLVNPESQHCMKPVCFLFFRLPSSYFCFISVLHTVLSCLVRPYRVAHTAAAKDV